MCVCVYFKTNYIAMYVFQFGWLTSKIGFEEKMQSGILASAGTGRSL